MLGSAIPRRWVVSLALVGLVSLFMASYSAVWASPASAGSDTSGTTAPAPTATTPPTGNVLTDLQAPTTLNLLTGQEIEISASPIDDDGNIDLDLPNVSYVWNPGSCGSLSSTSSRTTVFTASSSACTGTIVVHAVQSAGNIPSDGRSISVNVVAPPPTPEPTPVFTAADDGPLVFASDDAVNEILSSGGTLFSADARGANVVPSKSSSVVDPSGNSISIPAGSLNSGESKVVVVDKISVADLEAPPPPAKTGSTSGTFKFGSSVIQISFSDGGSLAAVSERTRLNRPAQVCMSYTPDDVSGAYGGPDGMNIWNYNGTEWVKLATTVFTNPNRVCAFTSSFSPFALGLEVAPPGGAEAATGLPATGDFSPGVGGLALAIMAGVALVGGGVFTARRARRVRGASSL